jgi:hypothetical protein
MASGDPRYPSLQPGLTPVGDLGMVDLKWLYFSLEGRCTRREFWLYLFVPTCIVWFAAAP